MLIHVQKDIIGPSSVHICPILPASAKALQKLCKSSAVVLSFASAYG
jgi:hypothetical protein